MSSQKYTYFQAPLAGYTDLPYRMACRAQGAYYMYTALIDSGALVYGNKENDSILKRGPQEPWLGVQLLGSIPEHVEKAAEMLDAMDYETLDFNMGCPMQKVVKRPAGAALIFPENHELALRCVSIIRRKVHKPFTVKMRIIEFENPEPTVALCRRLEEAGVEAITIHGRLTKSIYSGPVATDVIRAVRENLRIPVTANGGIFSYDDAMELAEKTGCTRLMVARGSLGNPWIFRELNNGRAMPPTHYELCDILENHIYGMVDLYGRTEAFPLTRKIIVAYVRGRGYSKRFREWASMMKSVEDFENFMKELRQEGPVCDTSALDNHELRL